jgi:hypothetical protein
MCTLSLLVRSPSEYGRRTSRMATSTLTLGGSETSPPLELGLQSLQERDLQMSNGLLVRVGIDITAGGWNSPCNEKEFCYVPMGSSDDLTPRYDEAYAPYREAVESFLPENAARKCLWPSRMPRKGHFDPDFRAPRKIPFVATQPRETHLLA